MVDATETRYKFYREHKYISFVLNELERLAAKTDFRDRDQVKKVQQELESIISLLEAHAHYEDTKLHILLKRKNSHFHAKAEIDHQSHPDKFAYMRNLLDQIYSLGNTETSVEFGYEFYTYYRRFVAEAMLHFHEEEAIVLPELQKYYTDDELRKVEAETYAIMTPEELVDMMQVLFPHMNPSDREHFLFDIKKAEPAKFVKAWAAIKNTIAPDEQQQLIKKLAIPS